MAPPQDIVVKFVDRYGKGAHELLAKSDLAPRLLYHGPVCLKDGEPSYESISMVVMEHVDGTTLAVAEAVIDKERMEEVRSQVKKVIGLLHDHNFVFGDLRLPNIMITRDMKVRLIDFNWAGVDGQAKYPLLISQEIGWPEGVKASALITREHDLDMLKRL